MSSLEDKVKLRVLEDRIEQLSGVIVPACLTQLQEQGRNIKRYQLEEEWESLRREQRNVTKTIRQLRTHVKELEDVKLQISEEDQNEFNQTIQPIQERILENISAFKHLDPSIPTVDDQMLDQEYVSISQRLEQVDVANEVWIELHQELQELQELSQTLLEQVKDHYEIVERLEQETNEAEEHVHRSMITIQKMAKIKSVMLPVGGAILGGVVGGVMGGPVGLLAGAKVGTLVAVAGGTAGAVGGGLIGYKRGQSIKEKVEELTPKKDQ